MTNPASSLEGFALLVPPTAGVATAAATAVSEQSIVGYVIAIVLTALVVPLVRWLMRRDDRRQHFEQEQARARDTILSTQAETLRDMRQLLQGIASRLDAGDRTREEAAEDLRDQLDDLPSRVARALRPGGLQTEPTPPRTT